MRTGILIIAVVLILVLIFSATKLLFKSDLDDKTSETCNEIEFPKLNKICLAYYNNNITECSDLEGKYLEICAKAVFSVTNIDESSCSNQNNADIRNICYTSLAHKTNDYNLCKNDSCYFLVGDKDACLLIDDIDYIMYTCLAQKTNDLNHCDEIHDEYEQIACKALFSSDIKNCKDTSGDYIPLCVILIARNSKNINNCDLLPTNYLRAKCGAFAINGIDECNALKGEESELCKMIFLGRNLETFYE